jgi:hypothetical protein
MSSLTNLPPGWDTQYSDTDTVKDAWNNTGLTNIDGKISETTNKTEGECQLLCTAEDKCNSYTYVNDSGGRCILSPFTQEMTDWRVPNAPGHKIVFKNTKSMTTKQIPVNFVADDEGPVGDISERSFGLANYTVFANTVECNNGGDFASKQNYYLGATGEWWDGKTNSNNSDDVIDGKYGCPKIGVITGGGNTTIRGCRNPSKRWGLKAGTAECSYSRIYHKDEKNLPTGSNAQTFSQLTQYFNSESKDLYAARESWCRSGGFDELLNNRDCQNILSFKHEHALIELILNTWYTTTDGCDKFTKVGKLMKGTLDTRTVSLFKDKINQLPTSGTQWSEHVIKALNAVMIEPNVIDEIKDAIKIKVDAYCNDRPGRGLSDTACGCKNAFEGWNSSDPTKSTCDKNTAGCADVVEYVNALKDLKQFSETTASPLLTKFASDYIPLVDAQACKNAYGDGSKTVLAHMKRPEGIKGNTFLCASLVQALDQATLSIKGSYNFKCGADVRTDINTNTGGGADDEDTAGDDDEDTAGDDDEDTPASNNIWLWVIVGVFSLLLMLGFGASLLFLF